MNKFTVEINARHFVCFAANAADALAMAVRRLKRDLADADQVFINGEFIP